MSFEASAGRIRITDAAGNERLDTDDGLFHIVNSGFNGLISMPAITISSGSSVAARHATATWDLGACHASCTHVIGAVRFGGSGNWGVAFARWTTYMGGDLVWAMTSPGLTASTAGDIGSFPRWSCLYRFYVSAGRLWMERRLDFPRPTGSVTMVQLGHTIEYRLKTGLFT